MIRYSNARLNHVFPQQIIVSPGSEVHYGIQQVELAELMILSAMLSNPAVIELAEAEGEGKRKFGEPISLDTVDFEQIIRKAKAIAESLYG